jgi:membrane-associated phospholipid phosphatase
MAVANRAVRIRRLAVVVGMLIATAALIAAENAGHFPPRPELNRRVLISGDIRREARALEQFGQVVSSILIIVLIWTLDPARRRYLPAVALTLVVTGGVVTLLKHTVARARPAAGEAGEFLASSSSSSSSSPSSSVGETDAKAESFPSGHSAAAAATAVVLTALYPRGRYIFWTLALLCAALRFVNNAHWLSDVVAGVTLGYVCARAMWYVLVERREAANAVENGSRTGLPAAARV